MDQAILHRLLLGTVLFFIYIILFDKFILRMIARGHTSRFHLLL